MYVRMNHHRASLVVQVVKNLPAMQDTWVQSVGWEDPLEKGIPWTEDLAHLLILKFIISMLGPCS